jgi:hypothetical protein
VAQVVWRTRGDAARASRLGHWAPTQQRPGRWVRERRHLMALSLYAGLAHADPHASTLMMICPRCGSHHQGLATINHGEHETASGPRSLTVKIALVCFDCEYGWTLTLWNEAGAEAVAALVEAYPLEDCPTAWAPLDRLYPTLDCRLVSAEHGV